MTIATNIGIVRRMTKQFYVYIMSNRRDGTLYIGVTSDLLKRVHQHREKLIGGFTKKYNLTRLVYFESYDDPENAILREKRMKKMGACLED